MTKKQDPDAIYAELDRKTQDLAAWAILKGGECVAKVVRHTGGRKSPIGLTVRAYVHVLGLSMVRGIARGGGYDMTSAAVLGACKRLDVQEAYDRPGPNDTALITCVRDFTLMKDSGQTWESQLRALGYDVVQVI